MMSVALRSALAAALVLAVASPSLAQDTPDARIVPSIGVGPQVGDRNAFFGSLHFLVEAEIEWDGLVATGYVEPYVPANFGCIDDCTPPTQVGLSGSVRRGSFIYGAGFSLSLDDWPNALMGRIAAEPGPFRLQMRPELMLDNDFIILLPVLLGVRLPWK